MRYFIVFLVLIVACTPAAKESEKDCAPIIDRAVGSLQKYGMVLDSTYIDSALFYYDDAMRCDSMSTKHHLNKAMTLGRYRESLTIIDNVFKVRDVPTSRDAHFFEIKGWLYAKLDEKDSSALYFKRASQFVKR